MYWWEDAGIRWKNQGTLSWPCTANMKKLENNNKDIIKWNNLKHYEKHIGCIKIFLIITKYPF